MPHNPSLPGSHNIARVTLDNGVTVLAYENFAAQSVVMAGSLRAGSLFETPAQNGLASLAAAALMRGTATRNFALLADTLESIGADVTISAGVHRTSFFGKALAEDLSVILDVLADVTQQPAFPVDQVERLRGEIMTGLRIRQQDTRYRANRLFHESLFPADHPYHYSVRGTLETIPTLTLDDLHAFHRRAYGPQDMIIVIVGAVTTAEAIDQVRQRFGGWHNNEQATQPPMPDAPVVTQPHRAHIGLAGKTQSDLMLGLPGPARLSPDYQAASIANSVLGQFGMMGRVGASVREELGLAYYVYSSMDAGMGRGAWSVAAGVNPKNVDLAIDSIQTEIRRLVDEPISEDDLNDNRSYYIGHLPLQLEANEGLASALLNIEMYGLGLDHLQTFRDRLMAITIDQVQAAARTYLDADRLIVAVAGPG